MMCSVLFSGGRDSSLAAIMLSPFYEVELVTCSFGILEGWKMARETARKLDFPFKLVKMDEAILIGGAKRIITDGYPRNGIQFIHRKAVETMAEMSSFVADGTRRDDRTPVLSLAEVRSIEDRYHVQYIRPLAGYGKSTIETLANMYFETVTINSDLQVSAEYEFEIREEIKRIYGDEYIPKVFPPNHTHHLVRGSKNGS